MITLELSLLTLNIWGIPFISLDRKIRINAIADQLAKGEYDIVSLQEVWSRDDYQVIKEKVARALPYAHYFYSGVFGSGLCLFSKYPIINAFFHAWPVNGYVHRIQHGDWFGGKGIGMSRILVKNYPVNVYVAHLHAEYDNENDEYKAHRVIQAFDTAQLILNTQNDAVLQILAGDLNTEPNDISFRVLTSCSKLTDTCNDHSIITNEADGNSYTSVSSSKKGTNPGKRIDHILFRPGKNHEIIINEYSLPLPSRVPGYNFSYSDHEAVYANFLVLPKCSESSPARINLSGSLLPSTIKKDSCTVDGNNIDNFNEECKSTETVNNLKESIDICDASLSKLRTSRIIYAILALFLIFLLSAIMDLVPPYGLQTLYLILKFLLSSLILFFMFMATLWNVIEKNAILSGKLSMEIFLNNLNDFPKNSEMNAIS